MLSESATPRTDALYPDHDFEAFARQLERELAAAMDKIKWYEECADAPLMKTVLRERDAAKKELKLIARDRDNANLQMTLFRKSKQQAEQQRDATKEQPILLDCLAGKLTNFNQITGYVSRLELDLKQAEQRLAEAEKNAERYRWLRKKADVDDYNSWGNWISHWLTTKELDKVIDAAIAQEKK